MRRDTDIKEMAKRGADVNQFFFIQHAGSDAFPEGNGKALLPAYMSLISMHAAAGVTVVKIIGEDQDSRGGYPQEVAISGTGRRDMEIGGEFPGEETSMG